MHADLALGLTSSLWCVLAITAVYAAIYFFVNSVISFDLDEWLLFAGVTLSTAASVACVLLPAVNLAFNIWQNPLLHAYEDLLALVRSEFASGVFPLRVTAVLVGAQAIRSLIKIGMTKAYCFKPEDWKQLFEFPEAAEVPALPPMTAYRNRYAQQFLNLTQSGFYEAAILVLWVLNLRSTRVPAAAALAWLLFYIVDDWRVINHYGTAFKGRIIRRHVKQVWLTNTAIFVLAATCAYHLSLTALLVYLAGTYFIVRLLLLLMNGVEGNLIIIDALNWVYINQRFDQTTGAEKPKAG